MALTTATKIQLGLSIALGVIVAALLVWGISTVSDNEQGLMKACWDTAGQAHVPSFCSEPKEITWEVNRLPLVVSGPPEHASELASAASSLNSQIGCSVLNVRAGAVSTDDIMVSFDVPMSTNNHDHPGGQTHFHRSATNRMTVSIDIFASGMGPTVSGRVLQHELGHALGLDHDFWNGSIMTQGQSDDVGRFVRLSDNDRELLHSLYCPTN